MTIAKQFRLKRSEKPLEESLFLPPDLTPKPPTVKDVEEGKPVVVTMHSHVRRVSSMTTVCVFLTALFVCGTGIIGGVYLYRQLSHYKVNKLRHFHGWCSIPYTNEKNEKANSFKSASLMAESQPTEATNAFEKIFTQKKDFFEEEFDIDIKFEQFERIEVPAFAHGKKAHFIHDFTLNKTAIADYENRRCFIFILNRNYIYPPRRLYELIYKMRAGYYDGADMDVLRQNYRVASPRPVDTKFLGLLIARDCASLPTYMLEHVNSPIFKRSLDDDSKELYVEFAGNKILEYKITNMQDAAPGK